MSYQEQGYTDALAAIGLVKEAEGEPEEAPYPSGSWAARPIAGGLAGGLAGAAPAALLAVLGKKPSLVKNVLSAGINVGSLAGGMAGLSSAHGKHQDWVASKGQQKESAEGEPDPEYPVAPWVKSQTSDPLVGAGIGAAGGAGIGALIGLLARRKIHPELGRAIGAGAMGGGALGALGGGLVGAGVGTKKAIKAHDEWKEKKNAPKGLLGGE